MPLSDRDYMRSSPPPARKPWRYRSYRSFNLNPVLVIILVNFVVLILTTILQNISGGTMVVSSLFGLAPALFFKHPWAIVTSLFIHAGFWHFFGNMITLYFFGTFLARLVGQKKFLMLYFGGGILGNVLYILLNMSSGIPVIGASGAVYAIAGALVVMMPNLRVFVYFIIPMRLWVVVLLFYVLWSFIPGVAWQAHLGGLVAGLIAGYFFRKQGRYYY